MTDKTRQSPTKIVSRAPAREAENDITWRRIRNVCRSDHEMLMNGRPLGIWVMAAQHPTALRPYYVSDAGAVSERKYSQLLDAKTAALTVLAERFEQLTKSHLPSASLGKAS